MVTIYRRQITYVSVRILFLDSYAIIVVRFRTHRPYDVGVVTVRSPL